MTRQHLTVLRESRRIISFSLLNRKDQRSTILCCRNGATIVIFFRSITNKYARAFHDCIVKKIIYLSSLQCITHRKTVCVRIFGEENTSYTYFSFFLYFLTFIIIIFSCLLRSRALADTHKESPAIAVKAILRTRNVCKMCEKRIYYRVYQENTTVSLLLARTARRMYRRKSLPRSTRPTSHVYSRNTAAMEFTNLFESVLYTLLLRLGSFFFVHTLIR